MGFIFRKRVRAGKRSWFNISKSGVSGSTRVGPFTVNSRGKGSVRLGNGLSYRSGCFSVLLYVALVASGVATVLGNTFLA
jgi:hypothetical protein